MRKFFTLLFLTAFVFTSCSSDGEVGPQGPEGPAGPPGELAKVIDVVGDFTSDNDYSLSVDFNDLEIEVFESDAVLVYMKTGEDGTSGGAPVEVFRMLPQTYYIDGETLQYNYDFTFFDVLIFLDGTLDPATLPAEYTNDKVFRVVIVPAEFAETSGVDLSNMNAVLNALGVKSNQIPVLKTL